MPQFPTLQTPSQAYFQQNNSNEMGNSHFHNINQVESQQVQVPRLKTSAYRHIAGGIAFAASAISFGAIGIISEHKILGPVSSGLSVGIAGIGGYLIGKGATRL